MTTVHLRFAILAVAATALAACSSTTDGTGGTEPTQSVPELSVPALPPASAPPAAVAVPDACTLLTHKEAQFLAGTKLLPAVAAGSGADATLCQYNGPTTGPTAEVQVIDGPGAEKALKIDRDTLKHPFTKLSGFGDEGWEEDDIIFVRKGTLWAEINLVLLNDPAQNKTRLERNAQTMLTRM